MNFHISSVVNNKGCGPFAFGGNFSFNIWDKRQGI
jgi:hypothetical protein